MRLVDRFKEIWDALPSEAKEKALKRGTVASFVHSAVEAQGHHNPDFKADKQDLDDVIRFVQDEKEKANAEGVPSADANESVFNGFLRNTDFVHPNLLTSAVLDHGLNPRFISSYMRDMNIDEKTMNDIVEVMKKHPDNMGYLTRSLEQSFNRVPFDLTKLNLQEEKRAKRKLLDHYLDILSQTKSGDIANPDHPAYEVASALSDAIKGDGIFSGFKKNVINHVADKVKFGVSPVIDDLRSQAFQKLDRNSILPKLPEEVEAIRQQGALTTSGLRNPNLRPEDIVDLMDKNPDIAEHIWDTASFRRTFSGMKPFWGKVPIRHASAIEAAGRHPALFMDLNSVGNRFPEGMEARYHNPTAHIDADAAATLLSKSQNISFGPQKWQHRVTPEGLDFIKDLADFVTQHQTDPKFENRSLASTARRDEDFGDKFLELLNKHNVNLAPTQFESWTHETVANLALALVKHDPERAAKLLDSAPSADAGLAQNYRDDLVDYLSTTLYNSGDKEDNKAFPPAILHHMKNENMIRKLSKHVVADPFDPELPAGIRQAVENEARADGFKGTSFDELRPNDRRLYLPMDGEHYSDYQNAAKAESIDKLMAHGNNTSKLEVKRRSENLRYLRDYLESLGNDETGKPAAVDPKELPKDKTWNSILATTVQKKGGKDIVSTNIDWNPLRDPKRGGKVTAESVRNYIDQMKPVTFHALESEWNGAQRHNDDPSSVVVFGISDDHVRKMKEAGVFQSFLKVGRNLPQTHPNHPLAIGWARYTTKGNRKFLDEIQSDLGKALDEVPEEHAQKINDILFEGSHPSDVLHEAFHQYARQKGWVGHKLGIHSTDTKRWISLKEPRKDVPIHFIHNYENFPDNKLNAEPGKYGEDHEQETNDQIKGLRVWRTEIRKMEEYSDWEDL